MSCCAIGCKNRHGQSKDIRFYRIPSMSTPFNVERRSLWLKAINRTNWSDASIRNARICSVHFISGKDYKHAFFKGIYHLSHFRLNIINYRDSSRRIVAVLCWFNYRSTEVSSISLHTKVACKQHKLMSGNVDSDVWKCRFNVDSDVSRCLLNAPIFNVC